MKAVRLHKTGGPEVLQIDEVPMPEAGPDQVLGQGAFDRRWYPRPACPYWTLSLGATTAHHSRYRDERYRRSPRCRRDRTA